MVLKENTTYTSLYSSSRRDDANTIQVRIVSPGGHGKGHTKQLRLRFPLDFGSAKVDIENLEQVRLLKRSGDLLIEFRAKGIDPVECILHSSYAKKLKQFLIRQKIPVISVNSAPILPINASSSDSKQITSPSRQKPQFLSRPSSSSSPALPSAPIVLARSTPRGSTHDAVSAFFPSIDTRALKTANVETGSSASKSAKSTLQSEPMGAKSSPKPRQRHPTMSSGDKSAAYKEWEIKIAAHQNTKRSVSSVTPSSSPASHPSKKRNTNAPSHYDEGGDNNDDDDDDDDDDQGALIEPTAEFISAIESSHRPIKYKHRDGRTTHITIQDISRLQEKVFLDDSLISFFLKLYHEKMHKPESAHVFSTFFYPRIDNEDANKKWIQRIGFASKSLLVIPVHQHAHWSAVVISGVDSFIADQKRPPTIAYFDSLGATHTGSREVFKKCVAFVSQVFASIPGMPVPASRRYTKIIAKVPVQSNLSDCGVFMLEFMRKVMETPEKYLSSLTLSVSDNELDFSKVYDGTLNSRKDYLDILKEYGSAHPDLKAPSDGELSELEIL